MIQHFPSPGRSCKFRVSSICSMLHCGNWLWQESGCLSKPVLCDPKFFALSCQHLDSGKIKTSPSGNPLKCLQAWCIFQSSPSLYSKMQEAETFFVTTLHWAGEKYYHKRLPHICLLPLTWLVLHSNGVQLLVFLDFWYLSTGIWISHKRNCSVYGWIHVFLGKRRVWSLLVDITTLVNSISISTFRCVNWIWEVRGLSAGHLG